jgi:hypothetical protein
LDVWPNGGGTGKDAIYITYRISHIDLTSGHLDLPGTQRFAALMQESGQYDANAGIYVYHLVG